MNFICQECSKTYPADTYQFQCSCGGLFDLHKEKGEKIEISVSLGEIVTPILERNIDGVNMTLKIDYLMPSGSFKDRGAIALVNHAKNIGVKEIVEDSSGNAGAAISAYCAAAGIKCNIYLPDSTSEGKIKQIKAYGANIVKIKGTRDDTAAATLDAARRSYYASHVYNPIFYEGTKSIGLEIFDQVDNPDWIVVPVGNGTMLIGLEYAFRELGRKTKILAVQSANCNPIYADFTSTSPAPVTPTIAEGIAIGKPMRKKELVKIIRDSGGAVVTVDDKAVLKANHKLAEMGIYCEPTSASAVAGALKYFKGNHSGNIVVPLTGSGLKKG